MEQSSPSNSSRRLRTLARLMLLWAVILVARLLQLQIGEADEYQAIADKQQLKEIDVAAPRGEILDRNGGYIAMNVPSPSAFLNARLLVNPAATAHRIARALDLEETPLRLRLESAKARNLAFVWIKRRLVPDEKKRLDALSIPGMDYRPETRRVYPNGTLAANLVGWVNEDGRGAGGLEHSANSELLGTPGTVTLVTDSRQHGADAQVTVPAVPGKSIGTTIDLRIQHVADEALRKAVEENGISTGSAVVMDPNTGEILAMSSYPSFDPNEPVHAADLSSRVNQAISAPFEPGSVFKVITFASAFETTNLRPEDIISCGNGVARLYGRVIHDHDSYASLSAADILAKSSNVGTINIALKVGLPNLLDYIRKFGFGRSTGLGLPGEASGIVRKYDNPSIGYVSIGHEIAVTTVQLARAASVVANGGFLVQPRLIAWKARPGELKDKPADKERAQVLRPESAITLRQLMERVVLHGTGTRAKLEGYTSGGKTGSAQIFNFETKHYTHAYNASFMGFAPVTNPSVVVVVTLNGAKQYGGVLAAPVFQEIATAAMRVREVRHDIPIDMIYTKNVAEPSVSDAAAAPEAPGFDDVELAGNFTAAAVVDSLGPRVPDFRGKALPAVVSTSVALGLPLDIQGRGLVRAQSPAPGESLGSGQKVRLTLSQ